MIKNATYDHKDAVLEIAKSINLFEPDELEEMDTMFDAFLSNQLGEKHNWVILENEGKVIATAYFAPETFARNVWNIYFIGVHSNYQRSNFGSILMKYIEDKLRNENERIILVETSSLPHLEKARSFYTKLGYSQEACIREFYNVGEDKIIFSKFL